MESAKDRKVVALPQEPILYLQLRIRTLIKIMTKISQNRGQNQDIAEITCYNCNKKGYYTKDCTKPKYQLQFQQLNLEASIKTL